MEEDFCGAASGAIGFPPLVLEEVVDAHLELAKHDFGKKEIPRLILVRLVRNRQWRKPFRADCFA